MAERTAACTSCGSGRGRPPTDDRRWKHTPRDLTHSSHSLPSGVPRALQRQRVHDWADHRRPLSSCEKRRRGTVALKRPTSTIEECKHTPHTPADLVLPRVTAVPAVLLTARECVRVHRVIASKPAAQLGHSARKEFGLTQRATRRDETTPPHHCTASTPSTALDHIRRSTSTRTTPRQCTVGQSARAARWHRIALLGDCDLARLCTADTRLLHANGLQTEVACLLPSRPTRPPLVQSPRCRRPLLLLRLRLLPPRPRLTCRRTRSAHRRQRRMESCTPSWSTHASSCQYREQQAARSL